MDLEQRPSWSKGDLRRLGDALVIDQTATPVGCPQYAEVMYWHNDLAAEVAARIKNSPWIAIPPDQLSISARPKTLRTLVQKLERMPTLKLGQVQDLAGVRVDVEMVLTQQTNLAQEIAEHFGAAPKAINDIRPTPHSGYRAMHVCLALPAGNVEVQIRTVPQSEWANVYEGLGELFGRGIRYDEKHENAGVQGMVDQMQDVSVQLALQEELVDKVWQLERGIESLSPPATPEQAAVLARVSPVFEQYAERYANTRAGITRVVEGLRNLRHIIDEQEV
jgi:ppGpp synthetase/RelA/SpoT-type nucleotidyltranferase